MSAPRNCKSCLHRGTVQFSNGTTSCDLYQERVSLGHVCRMHAPQDAVKPRPLLDSKTMGLYRYSYVGGTTRRG